MADVMVVVESPAKAKTINKFLGKKYQVIACMGHVRDLPEKDLGIDIEQGFRPLYKTIRGKGKVVGQLRSSAKSVGKVFLATDPDREGEAIAWHVAHEVGKDIGDVHRVLFNEITKRAVTKAVENPGKIDLNKVNAQQARRILDRLVGYKVSPILWRTIYSGLSAGRVQSVALRMICERQEEVDVFVPKEYWTVDVELKGLTTRSLKVRLLKFRNKKLEILNQRESDQVVTDLQTTAALGCEFLIEKITRRERRRHPSPPFITSTLQQDASRRLRFTARKTMAIAQQLYEGIELGGESTGLITYMRTDSTRLAAEAVADARSYIQDRFGKAYLFEKQRNFRKGKGAQDAHEAIRPTGIGRPPEELKAYLTSDQIRLYQLIWNRFIACQMSPAVFDQTVVEVTFGDYSLRVAGSILKFPGFTALYIEGTDEEQKEEGDVQFSDSLKEGDRLDFLGLYPEQHFTKPPPRYSEATLVKELEAQDIGRPSTYAQIISTLQDRDYVEKEGGRFTATELGKTVNKILVQAFPKIFNVDFTARLEDDLDRVENGDTDWIKVVEDFYGPFSKDLEKAENQRVELKLSLQELTGDSCEKCGEMMVVKWGRNGKFIACSGFPACRNTQPLGLEENFTKTDEICEKCGAEMVIRSGRRGRFIACSGYPDCKNTKPVALGVTCPSDGCEGELLERSSKRGKIFYSCSTYPDCEFATWDKPVNRVCPSCNGPFLAEHIGRKKEISIRCIKCKFIGSIEEISESVELVI